MNNISKSSLNFSIISDYLPNTKEILANNPNPIRIIDNNKKVILYMFFKLVNKFFYNVFI